MDIKYLNNYFSKEMAFQDFIKVTKKESWTKNKFKQQIAIYCELNKYIFNPTELQNHTGRIIRIVEGKAQEVYYIKSK